MIRPSGNLDPEKTNLAALVAALTPMFVKVIEYSQQQTQRGQEAMEQTGTAQNLAREERKDDVQPETLHNYGIDRVAHYEETVLEDGRVVRNFEDGRVQVHNPRSGVIQEEHEDGKFLVSMPNGKLLFQEYPGDPLIVYDLNQLAGMPVQARVGQVSLSGEEPRLMYHFTDHQGTHMVDVESLRYYRLKEAAAPARRY